MELYKAVICWLNSSLYVGHVICFRWDSVFSVESDRWMTSEIKQVKVMGIFYCSSSSGKHCVTENTSRGSTWLISLKKIWWLVWYAEEILLSFDSRTFIWRRHESSYVVMTGFVMSRADSRFAPSQWNNALICNDVSHWLGASLESALISMYRYKRKNREYDIIEAGWRICGSGNGDIIASNKGLSPVRCTPSVRVSRDVPPFIPPFFTTGTHSGWVFKCQKYSCCVSFFSFRATTLFG